MLFLICWGGGGGGGVLSKKRRDGQVNIMGWRKKKDTNNLGIEPDTFQLPGDRLSTSPMSHTAKDVF